MDGLLRTIDHATARMSIDSSPPRFTETQGQYLAFIYFYSLVNRRPPAEADIQSFFAVTPPTVHRMVIELERRGLISRVPRQARSIALRIPAEEIPRLRPQSIESSVERY
jgi:DNA-binding MarR family transcriptional regulator